MKKIVFILIGLFLIVFIFYGIWRNKDNEFNLPSLKITYENDEIEFEVNGYKWNKNGQAVIANSQSTENIAKKMKGNNVPVGGTLNLKFSKEPKSIKVVEENSLKNIEYTVTDNTIITPTELGEHSLVITGEWEEGYVNYIIKIEAVKKEEYNKKQKIKF
ncbi:hypothetical protein QYB59_001447 [Clostridium perfringens]|nr:hypothetical protein [Clostridium perfringens]